MKFHEPVKQVSELVNRLVPILALLLTLSALGLVVYWAYTADHPFNGELLFHAMLIGMVAQLVDGALGMAYGVTATTFLLSYGMPPAIATGAVHIAEIFTTGASGLSHWKLGNVSKRLFLKLLIPGIIGGVIGVMLITSIDGKAIRPWMSAYLFVMGMYILYKAFRTTFPFYFKGDLTNKKILPLAFTGAFVDAVGGGGWGPVVTTTLVSSGHEPRITIGSVNSAEFFITLATGFSFALLIGVWQWEIIAGLIAGGMLTAPIAATLVSRLPVKVLMIFVGLLITSLSAYNIFTAF